jgi:hypothetical protein
MVRQAIPEEEAIFLSTEITLRHGGLHLTNATEAENAYTKPIFPG